MQMCNSIYHKNTINLTCGIICYLSHCVQYLNVQLFYYKQIHIKHYLESHQSFSRQVYALGDSVEMKLCTGWYNVFVSAPNRLLAPSRMGWCRPQLRNDCGSSEKSQTFSGDVIDVASGHWVQWEEKNAEFIFVRFYSTAHWGHKRPFWEHCVIAGHLVCHKKWEIGGKEMAKNRKQNSFKRKTISLNVVISYSLCA